MYINHLTLTTGHLSRIESGDVAGETLARTLPWMLAAIDLGNDVPLPVAELVSYAGRFTVVQGSLICTISGPPSRIMEGKRPPLVTMGVAKRSRHGAVLWPMLAAGLPGSPVLPGVKRPAEPWAAVVMHPTGLLHPEANEWLGDLERCIAWAWVTRPSDVEAADDAGQ
jgi:hypothetical protein